jgi:hypothetical protein
MPALDAGIFFLAAAMTGLILGSSPRTVMMKIEGLRHHNHFSFPHGGEEK